MRLLLHIVMAMAFNLSAWAESVKLVDVYEQDQEQLQKEVPGLFSGTPTLAELDQALKLLLATSQYENVHVEQLDNGSYQLAAKPIRIVEKVVFKGNSSFSSSELRELIEIKAGDRFERRKAVAAGEKLKEHYGQNGFFNTIIDLNFIKGQNQNIILNFEIKELTSCRIQTVEIETENLELKARLEKKFSNRQGKMLTIERAQKLNEDLNEFLMDNRYLVAEVVGPNVRYNTEKTEAYLSYEIRDADRWEFYFEGNQYNSVTALYRALDLKNRERKNIDPASEGAERIKRLYLSQGFPVVQVEPQVRVFEFLKRVTYKITEGQRVQIQRMEIQGRISREAKYYYKFIRDNSSELVSRGYYNRQDLELGFKNLVTELRNQGFLRARVQSSRVEYNNRKDQVVIHLLMDEGPRTQVRAIDFEGNRFISSFELGQVMGLDANMPLKLNTLEASIETLKSFYLSQGFLEMKLLNEGEDIVQYNDSGTHARLFFRIFEGPRIRINTIAVEGNSFTRTDVILRQANFRTGDVLTPTKIDEATVALNRMGIFSRVNIHTLEEGSNVSERTLVISVSERDPGVLRFGAGVNDERGFTARGFSSLSYNNLWGTGRSTSVRGEIKNNVKEVKYNETEFSIGYLEPFLLNTRTRGRVNLTRFDRVYNYTKENRVTNISLSNRFDALLERDFNKHHKLTWKLLSLDFITSFEREGRCLNEKDKTVVDLGRGKCPPTAQQVSLIGPIFDIDYRDNPFLPTKGSFTRLSLDYSDPLLGSSTGIKFIKPEGQYTYYLRLGSDSKIVWANSLRAGYVKNLLHSDCKYGANGVIESCTTGVPASHAFFLGGLFTVRGFDNSSDNNRIPPERELPFSEPTTKLINRDAYYGLIKSELRFPISGDHGGVLFYDGGLVQVTERNITRPYRDAVGIGYRYNTPVGPAALDLAFKIRPRKFNENGNDYREEPFRLHFSIGTF